MNAYYRDKINGLIMHMAERLVEYYIDYKVYRSIFGVVLEFDRYRITFDNDCKYYQLEFLVRQRLSRKVLLNTTAKKANYYGTGS